MNTILQSLMQEVTAIVSGNVAPHVGIPVTAAAVRQHLSQYTFKEPVPLEVVLEDVVQMMRTWNLQMTHPRYLGLFNPATTLASVVAETLVALYNPQLAAWSHAPAANEIERHTLHYVGTTLGFPAAQLAASFTSGGSEANLTAMLAAMASHFPHYLEKGLMQLGTQPVFYVSEYAHNSFDKICKNIGIGANAMRVIPADDQLKMDVSALQAQIAKDLANQCTPFMVVGTAGTTAAGIIDPLPELAELCKKQHIWFHVDAAWAGAIVFSEKLKPLLKGIELADSVTMDAHKWFSVSFGAGMFFCRHKAVISHMFSVRADYMPKSEQDISDPYTSTLQWTRRFMGLKLFMTLAESGESAFSRLLENQTSLGDYFRRQLLERGWKISNSTPLPVVCFTHRAIESREVSITGMLHQIYQEANLWISAVSTSQTQKVFRACITNYHTTEKDIDFVVRELEKLLQHQLAVKAN
ncbi:aminotransferase class V-fold PLP-dependent enzyme [Rhodocytophaga aerolata]|uniref:Aminotransferase class V-fold PLP-dependent enzyme n=1 Tax=Rhodocytophaga aerolata TaxID=455078 RepID=A0ABT8RD23_9BACT|nr:aminotransferase class V-fold PLP-dependent enzyme [Rhodocytophaga aerolata]MDO1450007.1 aminotransferase class V-fold PLP-dependent enzyme [Rhodocytophaga aerolata]